MITTTIVCSFSLMVFYSTVNYISDSSFKRVIEHSKDNILTRARLYNHRLNKIYQRMDKDDLEKSILELDADVKNPLEAKSEDLKSFASKYNYTNVHLIDRRNTEIVLSSYPAFHKRILDDTYKGAKEYYQKQLKKGKTDFRFSWNQKRNTLGIYVRRISSNENYFWDIEKVLHDRTSTTLNKVINYLRNVDGYDPLVESVAYYSSDLRPRHNMDALKLPGILSKESHKEDFFEVSNTQVWFKLETPKWDINNQLIKYVGIKFTNRTLFSEIQKSSSLLVGVVLLSIFLAVFLSFYFSLLLSRAIQIFINRIYIIDKNPSVKLRIPEFWNNELNKLSQAFNTLLSNLESKTEKTQKMAKDILKVADSERKLISRDIHDTVGQLLTAATFKLVQGHKKEAEDIIVAANEELRGIYERLEPRSIEQMSLHQAVEFYLHKFFDKNLNYTIDLGSVDSLATNNRIQIYRIIQESIANIRKHSPGSKRVSISAKVEDGLVSMSIKNDLDGSSIKAYKKGFGRGLENIHLRVQPYGGNLKINKTENFFEILAKFRVIEDKEL